MRLLAERGWEVYAGVRRAEDGERLRQEAGGVRITPLILDITDAQAVAGVPDAVGGRLDALVNNAGIVVPGPVEALDIDDLRAQLETNVVGQVAVTQAVLPLLRLSRGRITFIGSVSGRVASPLLGAYAASKFALEGLVDALRVELRPWGIHVVLIEPGSIDTDIWRGALETADEVEAKLSPELKGLYADQIKGVRKLTVRIQKQTAPARKVAEAVARSLTDRHPRARYLVGADARGQVLMRGALPTAALDAILARVSGSR